MIINYLTLTLHLEWKNFLEVWTKYMTMKECVVLTTVSKKSKQFESAPIIFQVKRRVLHR
jgi:hypothetical protein